MVTRNPIKFKPEVVMVCDSVCNEIVPGKFFGKKKTSIKKTYTANDMPSVKKWKKNENV